jgi:fatty-acyl-CoA synthase
MFTALSTLTTGGCTVTLTSRSFDPVELLETVEREGVNGIAWVGDAFCKPVLRALDDHPGKWDISSLRLITSSGVMWSEETKQGLFKHHPGMIIADSFSSSEALGLGTSVSTAGGTPATAKFVLGDSARVISDDGRDVVPGSGEVGRVAVKGRGVPLGYYKDEVKSAATFLVIDGERYSVPGDYATVEADGSLTLLGRGSVCINTGGEKVFPEEVEEVLKRHPGILDAVAVGVPDAKFGEAITAVVEAQPGAALDEGDVIAHVKAALAAFKAPKRVLVVDSINRAPNGKVAYKGVRARALAAIGLE